MSRLTAVLVVVLVFCPLATPRTSFAEVRNADSSRQSPMRVLAGAGTIDSLTATLTGCILDFTVTVTADTGGGTDTFALEVWDDRNLVTTTPLSAPADGASHTISGSVSLPGPPGQGDPGYGVYLVDGVTTLDSVDPYVALDTCIPTLSEWGIIGMALAMFSSVVLMRRRWVS